jgi:hypothetical protein
VRALGAIFTWVTRRHTRGPLLFLVGALFALIVASLPLTGDPGSSARFRTTPVMHLGAARIVLLVLAVALPFVSLGLRRGVGSAAAVPLPVRQLGTFLAHGCLVAVSALLLFGISYALLRLRVGDPDARQAPIVVRTVLGSAPESATPIRGGHPVRMRIPYAGVPGDHPVVWLHLKPRLVLDMGAEASSMRGELMLHWRREGQAGFAPERITFRRNRPEILELRLDDPGVLNQAGGSRWQSGVLEIEFLQVPGTLVSVFDPDSIVLYGPRGYFLTALLRAFLALGLAAFPALALCHWLSGFVSYPIAVAGGLTGVLALALGAPGFSGMDPAARLAAGGAVGWGDLVGALLAAGICTLVVTALPFIDRRLREGSS